MLKIVLTFKWSHLDTNLWICNMSICHKHANSTPTFGKVLVYRRYCRRQFKSSPWTRQGNNIWITEFCNHPGWSNELKTICIITMYLHFGHIYSEMGKENKLTCRNFIFIIYLQTKNKKWNEMRWKRNLALNKEMRTIMMMVKKLYKNYLQKLFT